MLWTQFVPFPLLSLFDNDVIFFVCLKFAVLHNISNDLWKQKQRLKVENGVFDNLQNHMSYNTILLHVIKKQLQYRSKI